MRTTACRAKLSFKIEGEIKAFQDEQKVKQFMTIK
jgi:hypothetical protein